MTAYDDLMRELREFSRYTGDGKPGAPVNALLPIGDPQSGVHNPKKANLRLALGNLAQELMDGVAYVGGTIPAINDARSGALADIGTARTNAINDVQSWTPEYAQVTREAVRAAEVATAADRVQTGLDVASTATNRALAQTAKDAAFVNANVYPDIAAGLLATTNGQQFQVVSGNETIRYRRDSASTRTEVARFPTANLVAATRRGSSSLRMDTLGAAEIESATVGSTTPDTTSSASGVILASGETWPNRKAYLDNIEVRFGAAGTGEIHVYEPVTNTTWLCTHVVPITWDAGVNAYSAGLGSLPVGMTIQKGGFVGIKLITGGGIRYATASGKSWWIVSSDTGVGSTVTQAPTANIEVAIKVSAVLSSDAEPLLTSARDTMVSAALAYGSGQYPDISTQVIGGVVTGTGLFAAGSIASIGVVSDASRVRSVEFNAGARGRADLRVYEPIPGSATFKCVASYPVFCLVGNNVFSVDDRTLPATILVSKGGFVGLKSAFQLLQYGTGSPGFRVITGDAAVGATVSIADTLGSLQTSMKVTYDVVANSVASRVAALEQTINSSAVIAEAVRRVAINYGLTPLLTSMASYTLGDSTVAAYLGATSLLDLTGSIRNKVQVAVPGHTIAQQRAAWNALTVDPALVGWVVIQIGLNDMAPTEAASVAIARIQDLVATVRNKVGTKPIFISKMVPCRQRWIDIYGATDGPTAQAKWVAMNEAIAGNGSTPITGVDGRIVAHVPLMDDGAGNMKPIYLASGPSDQIHPNNAGRAVNAKAIRDFLHTVGLVV